MKNIFRPLLILVLTLTVFACQKEKKSEEKTANTATYKIDAEHSSVQWTAYKTTDKVPVKGTFKEINVKSSEGATTAAGSLEGLEFEIPVSSIYSKDSIRDGKLNKFFFEVMENTMSLKGKFSLANESTGNLALQMNGMTKELPFSYTISKDTLLINATMDLNAWQAQNAVESLHQACLELHTGADGVSKTWDEVGISAKILTVKK